MGFEGPAIDQQDGQESRKPVFAGIPVDVGPGVFKASIDIDRLVVDSRCAGVSVVSVVGVVSEWCTQAKVFVRASLPS